MKKILTGTALLLVMILNACTKGGEIEISTGDRYKVDGTADTKQLVPTVNGTATSTLAGVYDEQTNVMTFTLSWTGLWTSSATDAITAVRFYGPATAGANGTLLHTIAYSNSANLTGSVNLTLSGSYALIGSEKNDLFAGKIYYVICTQKNPDGIVRGQLTSIKQ